MQSIVPLGVTWAEQRPSCTRSPWRRLVARQGACLWPCKLSSTRFLVRRLSPHWRTQPCLSRLPAASSCHMWPRNCAAGSQASTEHEVGALRPHTKRQKAPVLISSWSSVWYETLRSESSVLRALLENVQSSECVCTRWHQPKLNCTNRKFLAHSRHGPGGIRPDWSGESDHNLVEAANAVSELHSQTRPYDSWRQCICEFKMVSSDSQYHPIST